MNDTLEKVITESTFTIQAGRFVYVKVSEAPKVDDHFMVTKDPDEITVVTNEDNLPGLSLIEKNKDFYKLISLNVSVPFYSVGLLATVSQAIAQRDMNILIVSTYSKDYIMVKDDRVEDARLVLLELGFKATS